MSDEEQVQAPGLFTLTKITGRRRNEDREAIIMSFEVGRRHLAVFLTGLLPTLLVTGLAAIIIGLYALLVAVPVMAGWFFLVDRRSNKGLRTRTWRTILDKRNTLAGRFLQCGQVIDHSSFADYTVMAATVPARQPGLLEETSTLLMGDNIPARSAHRPRRPPAATGEPDVPTVDDIFQ